MSYFFSLISFVDRLFVKTLRFLTIVFVLGMGGLVFLQVVLRDVFDTGILGAETASRHMVLWIAFLGAMLGTQAREHISIDIIARALSGRARNILRIFLDGVACLVAWTLARAAYTFVLDERAMGGMLFDGIPTWWAQTIIPFGFAMIALEYAVGVILDVWKIFALGDQSHTAGEWRKYIST